MYEYVVVTERGGTHLCRTRLEANRVVDQFVRLGVHSYIYKRLGG